ncbi:SiaB family protein kinase [Caballeronia sp. LZ034LL]|uniref:SiaB family protein kinase n=1 Tax=Caballeronia sp. LZ034LL TaxID=3038567 RepID=UPI0028631C18|nr:SiaB family protein kinase [Caballeronia sp. LZ034LL]MDR5837282.1 SiaB family protein kinase [Caballeronia sp. LZ034LL]
MSQLLDQDSAFFDLAQRRNVLFYHKGYFSHNIVAAMGEVVKLQLEVAGVNGPTRRKLFSSFVELSQNIVHYSSNALARDGEQDGSIREGAVCISRDGDRHVMLCVNPISSAEVESLRNKLEPLRHMSLEQIKQAYKESLRAETPEDSKGAGMGFLTMARDASAPLEFAFHPRADEPGTTLFCLMAII